MLPLLILYWPNSMKKHNSDQNKSPALQIAGGRLLRRHHDFFAYVIFGFIASLINIVTFLTLHNGFSLNLITANTIAFFVSNLISFIMNKKAVFISEKDAKASNGSLARQIGLFFLYRILSLIPDNLVMLIGLSWLQLNSVFVKALDQVIVGIFNYITTKSVFKQETSRLRKLVLEARDKRRERE